MYIYMVYIVDKNKYHYNIYDEWVFFQPKHFFFTEIVIEPILSKIV